MAASNRFATVSEDDSALKCFFFSLFFETITCVFILKQLLTDSLEWSFRYDTLRSYGFGASLIKWVRTLYRHTESCILNNDGQLLF